MNATYNNRTNGWVVLGGITSKFSVNPLHPKHRVSYKPRATIYTEHFTGTMKRVGIVLEKGPGCGFVVHIWSSIWWLNSVKAVTSNILINFLTFCVMINFYFTISIFFGVISKEANCIELTQSSWQFYYLKD